MPDGLLVCEDEGEVVLRDVLSARMQGKPFDGIPGLSAFSRGAIVRGRPSEPLQRVDDIPSPYLSGMVELNRGNRYFQLHTTRGCIGKCSFCMAGISGPRLRHFDLQRVADELEWAAAHEVSLVVIADAAINYHNSHLEALCEAITASDRDRALRFSYCLHPAFITPKQVSLLRRIVPVTESIIIGVQSLSSAAQSVMNRGFSSDRVLRGLELISEVFTPNIDLILGMPGETLESFEQSIRTLASYPINLHIHPLTIVSGTEYALRKEEFGIQHEDHRGSFRVTSCDTFTGRDFYLSLLFIQGLARDGALRDSRLNSLHMNGYSYFRRAADGPQTRAGEHTAAATEPSPCTIDPDLLAAVRPVVSVGAIVDGWAIVASEHDGATIAIAAESGDQKICMRLHQTSEEAPCFMRTSFFNVEYWHPKKLSPAEGRWLESFVSELSRRESAA